MQEGVPLARTLEDAPREMRQELIDVFFGLVEQNVGVGLSDDRIFRVISQSLGIAPAGNPYGGYPCPLVRSYGSHGSGKFLSRNGSARKGGFWRVGLLPVCLVL